MTSLPASASVAVEPEPVRRHLTDEELDRFVDGLRAAGVAVDVVHIETDDELADGAR